MTTGRMYFMKFELVVLRHVKRQAYIQTPGSQYFTPFLRAE